MFEDHQGGWYGGREGWSEQECGGEQVTGGLVEGEVLPSDTTVRTVALAIAGL